MMILVNAFIYKTKKQRFGSWFHVNGPLLFTLFAVPLIMADLVRHLLQDHGAWNECDRDPGEIWPAKCKWSSSQYKCEVAYDPTNTTRGYQCVPNSDENMKHLSLVGVLFTIVCTYSGFLMLFIGVLWNAQIVKKLKEIKKQWTVLRAEMREAD